jgi:hypothetical protein
VYVDARGQRAITLDIADAGIVIESPVRVKDVPLHQRADLQKVFGLVRARRLCGA